MTDNTRPQMTGMPPIPSPETIDALGKLATVFQGIKQQYVPITKSLELIGIEPRIMTVMIGEEPKECLVVIVEELMHKEWLRMIDRNLTTLAKEQERTQGD